MQKNEAGPYVTPLILFDNSSFPHLFPNVNNEECVTSGLTSAERRIYLITRDQNM